jgi:hypothetical protein
VSVHNPHSSDAGAGRPARDLDSPLAAAVMVAGVFVVAAALRRSARALIMYAGLEGSVALILVAAALAMLGGLRARTMLALLAPIVALQIGYLWLRSIPWLAAAGVELTGMGAIGLAGTKLRAFLASRYPSSPDAAPGDRPAGPVK